MWTTVGRRTARVAWPLGTAAIVLAFSKVHAVWHEYDFSGSTRFAWALGFILLLWVVGYAFGVPDAPVRGTFATSVLAAGTGVVAISIVQLFVGDALLPRFVVGSTGLVAIAWNDVCTRLASGRSRGASVLLVGSVDNVETLRGDLRDSPERPGRITGVIVGPDVCPSPSDRAPVVTAARRTGADVVVLTRDAQDDDAVITQAAVLHEGGVRIRTLTAFTEEWLGKLPVDELERISVLFDIGEVHLAGYPRLKRMLDLAAATVGAVALLVALPLVVLGDLVANRGSLFFTQARVGRGGRDFRMLKFRTMSAAAGPTVWTEEHDVRVTPFGRFLRGTHLDELPQVLNVLRGDLSIVGPRPEQPAYVTELREKIPFYDVRHLVRPGITGWAQVKYHYGANEMDALEKLQYEMWYLRHQSLVVDARIWLRTLRHVMANRGR